MSALLCKGCMNLGRITTKVTHLQPPNARFLYSARCPGQLFKGIKLNDTTQVSKIVFIPKRAASREALFRPTLKLARTQASDGVSPKYTLIYRADDVASYFVGGQCTVLFFLCAITVVIGLRFVKVEENEEELKMIAREPSKPLEDEGAPLQPRVADIWEGDDDGTVYLILLMTLGMAFTTALLIRRFPVRIYASASGHCYGIFYSPLIPGRKVQKEFVAGTLKAAGKSKIFKNQLYRDGSGGLMFLLEDNFRTPMDYNELLDSEDDSTGNSKS